MTNPMLELIHAHGSARDYKSDPVPDALIETIVSAAQRASTSSNLQAYSVVCVTDATKREKLAQLCGKQMFIAQAPVFLAWCADLARLDRVCELRGYTQIVDYTENFMISGIDVAIAAQNAALAAESLGLGMCYIGSIRNNPREIIALLELPHLVFPIVGMTVGFTTRTPRLRPRLPLEAILHRERYDAHHDDALREYDRAMAATGIYNQRQVPVPGKPEQVEDYGWLEHTARRVSQATRKSLREVLEEQGFALK